MTILLSIALLLWVFLRRYSLFSKGPIEKPAELVEESDLPEKQRISKADRAKAESLYKRGELLMKAGKEDDAIKSFVQALAIDALHQETQHKLAILYFQKQMYGAAAALFKQLSEMEPDPVHLSHLGLSLFHQSDFENAKIAYQKALGMDNSRPQRFVSLAQVYRSLGQLQHAIIALNKAIGLEEENLSFLFLLADIQMEVGSFAAAEKIAERILEIEPDNKEAVELMKEIAAAKSGEEGEKEA